MKIRFLLSVLFASTFISVQPVSAQLNEQTVIPKLKEHISTLASDEFEGRETGEKGEQLSYQYIVKQFDQIGLTPKGTLGYLQAFPFTKETYMGAYTSLTVNGVKWEAGKDFYPSAYSANQTARGELINVNYGISAPKIPYDDYKDLKNLKGKIFLMEISTPDHAGPHSKYDEFADMRLRIDSAIAKGATGIIFINSDKDFTDPKNTYENRISPVSIPVLFVAESKREELLKPGKKNIELASELLKREGIGHNVIGYIDNGAAYTIVVGAHYDHLGMGHDGSLYRGEPAIHNGADDNASGTAALIELARYIKSNGSKSNNYLFMAFSGEEKGLLGSNFWVKNPTVPLEKINYMLNMDMVGRLKPEEPVLLVNGTGTSDAWKITMNYITVDSLRTKNSESGVGPSDHTSFYLKDIPVLHFFSGTHSDYHKPSDDEKFINYKGEFRIMNYMVQLIQKLDDKGKLNFVKTKDDNNEDAPRFKVTLGVVPDYAFEGQGMRIDGITDGRPASKAGMKAGDVVTGIGENKVVDMMSYMKALGKFNKGDKAEVTIMREKQEMKMEVTF